MRRPFAATALAAAVVVAFVVTLGAGQAATGDSRPSLVPAWASTGFAAYKCGNQLCLMRPDGSGQRGLLRRGPWPQWDASVSPDGRFLAFRGYYEPLDGTYALYVTGTNGCGVRRLTRDIASNPSWSPGGRWIVFDTSGAGELWKVRLDGSGLTRIATAGRPYYQYQPAWSPDGTEIAVVRYFRSRGQVWLMRPDGSGKKLLHSDARASDEEPAWSHDGKSLAFVAHVGQLATPGEHTWIDTITATGSNLRRLTRGQADTWNPVWLPHDSGIAFLSGLGGSGDLYVMRQDGSGVRKITALDTPQFTWADATLPRQAC